MGGRSVFLLRGAQNQPRQGRAEIVMQPQLLLDGCLGPRLHGGASALSSEGEEPEEEGSVGGREREHALRLGLVPRLEENGHQGALRAGNAREALHRMRDTIPRAR